LKGSLKKQSQFFGGQKRVSVYLKGHYGNLSGFEPQKTKPNKANLLVMSAA
jgi:hypothetical protein